jgi:hypothetical protein
VTRRGGIDGVGLQGRAPAESAAATAASISTPETPRPRYVRRT